MTFHESYGTLPMRLLRTYKRLNVSPADHDAILYANGFVWQDADNMTTSDWASVAAYVESHTVDGIFRQSRWL